jgi:hypothetical protein
MPRKSGTSGSEGGRRKRTSTTGTSLAAYPTACTVLRGCGAVMRRTYPTRINRPGRGNEQ